MSKKPSFTKLRSIDGYVTLGQAADIIGCAPRVVRRYANLGKISVWSLPTAHTRYCEADCQRLREEALKPARTAGTSRY